MKFARFPVFPIDFPGLGLLDPGHPLCVGSGLWWFERHWALAGDAGGAAGAADFLCQAERQSGHFLGFFPWERIQHHGFTTWMCIKCASQFVSGLWSVNSIATELGVSS